MTVKVILREAVPSLGQAGEIKQVAPGYLRNFLLPRGLAVEATRGQIAALEATSSLQEGRLARSKERSGAVAQQLGDLRIQIPVRLGEQGRIFGSVTSKDIAEAIATQGKVEIDRHKIELREPLKTIGVHSVPIKLEQGVEASVSIELVPEAEPAQ